jgi:stage II sporulation protein AA (anti-sigma F factor antagonist)
MFALPQEVPGATPASLVIAEKLSACGILGLGGHRPDVGRTRRQDLTSGPVVESEESRMSVSFLSFRQSSPPPARREPPPQRFMSTRRAESGGSIRLIFAAELDLAARSHFQAALDAAQGDSRHILLDLTALTFLDCACLASLFGAARRGRREGAQLVLYEPTGQVRRLLELTGTPAGFSVLDPVGASYLSADRPDRSGRG